MRLLAISDLHIDHAVNLRAVEAMPHCPDDWLIVAGDIGHTPERIEQAFRLLTPRFRQLVWVPGNHDLWTVPKDVSGLRGVHLYKEIVALARAHGVLTPEDPYATFKHPSGPLLIVPLFLLYDYSFRPDTVPLSEVVAWADARKCVCSDEYFLHPNPFPSRIAWCEARCRATLKRLSDLPLGVPTVLINHYPLKQRLAVLPRIPRFTPWCGTTQTEDWHIRFSARAVIYGHLHIRQSRWVDGVPFQEVSLGNPKQWDQDVGIDGYLNEVILAPPHRTVVGQARA